MLSRKQAAEQRRALKREIDREHRKKARAKVADLRAQLRDARAHKTVRVKELAERCRSERITVRDRLRELRARVLEELRETARAEREAARQACVLRRGGDDSACGTAVERARAELLAERTYQNDLRRIERNNRARVMASPQACRAERRGESDDEVRQNVPRDLVPLFERVKRSIKASPRMTRTEAFLQYAEEHPHEVFEVIEDKTEQMIRDLERKHRAAERAALRSPRTRVPRSPPPRGRASAPAKFSEVPF